MLFFPDVSSHLHPVEESLLIDHVNQHRKDTEAVDQAGYGGGKGIVKAVGIEQSCSNDGQQQTDDLIAVSGKNATDKDGQEVLEYGTAGGQIHVDGDACGAAGAHDLIDGDQRTGDDKADDTVGNLVDTGVHTDLLVVDESQLVITVSGIAQCRCHDKADNDQQRNQNDGFLEETGSVGTHGQINRAGRAVGGCHNLCDTFIDQAHTQRNNNGRQLGGDQHQRVNKAQHHTKGDAQHQELEDVLNGVHTGYDQGCEQASKDTGCTQREVHSAGVQVGIQCQCSNQGHNSSSAHDHDVAQVVKGIADDKQANTVGIRHDTCDDDHQRRTKQRPEQLGSKPLCLGIIQHRVVEFNRTCIFHY